MFFLDGDDKIASGLLGCLNCIIEQHPHEKLIRFGFEQYQDGTDWDASCVNVDIVRKDISRQIRMSDFYTYVWQHLYRRDVIQGMLFKAYRRGCDRVFVDDVLLSRVNSFVETSAVFYGYGHSKLMFEQICNWHTNGVADFKLRPTFLRYFNAAGAAYGMVEDHEPETHIIPNVLKVALGKKDSVEVFGDDYPTSDGTCIRDYVHLKDLASAHILALEKEVVGAFNLGTGMGISVKEIVEACRKVTGHPIPVKMCPRRPGDPPALYASGRKAREILGWDPRFSNIETIVRDAWESFAGSV